MQAPILAPPTARTRVSERARVFDGEQSALATRRSIPWRLLVVVGCVFAVAVPALWVGSAPTGPTAADLTRLLRTMEVLKAAIAVVSLGVVWWRFAFPVLPRFALTYVGASWLMASGSVVMWQLTHLMA